MLRFIRDKNKVKVQIEHGIFRGNEYFELEIDQTLDYQAELLKAALQKNLNRHLLKIKEAYYQEGWKDAKAKRRKRINFWDGWC